MGTLALCLEYELNILFLLWLLGFMGICCHSCEVLATARDCHPFSVGSISQDGCGEGSPY